MLGRQGIVPESEVEAICEGLDAIQVEIESGLFPFREELEDIHMNVETRLAELIGEPAGRLHTARSRNDQVALDVRLFLREAIDDTIVGLRSFQNALLSQAETNADAIMPGYTHLQRAQPVLVAHHLLAYFEMAQRDIARFKDCRRRTNVLPLGAGALAGVTYPIDREFVASELGFDGVARNSMDAVSDRDFLVEFHAAAAIAMMHLSRLAEEMIIWTSEEFGFASLAPEYTTGSSIMPQKRNPDVAELGRGKTGRVYGNLVALLTTLKALPLAYNKDMQEDKEGLFDTVDTLNATLNAVQRNGRDHDHQQGEDAEGCRGGCLFRHPGHGPCGLPRGEGVAFPRGTRSYKIPCRLCRREEHGPQRAEPGGIPALLFFIR